MIASNVGGLKDIIQHDKTGLLVNEGDSSTFVAGIYNIFNQNKDIKKISEASIENAFSLSEMQKIGNKYADVYKKIILTK